MSKCVCCFEVARRGYCGTPVPSEDSLKKNMFWKEEIPWRALALLFFTEDNSSNIKGTAHSGELQMVVGR